MAEERFYPVDTVTVELSDPDGVETTVSADGEMFDRQLFGLKVELALQEAGVWVVQELSVGGNVISSETPFQIDEDIVRLAEWYLATVSSVRVDLAAFKRIEFDLPYGEDMFDRLQVLLDELNIEWYTLREVHFYSDPMDEAKCAGVIGRTSNDITISRIKKGMEGLNFCDGEQINFEFIFVAGYSDEHRMYNGARAFLLDLAKTQDALASLGDDQPDDEPEFVYVDFKLASGVVATLPVRLGRLTDLAEFVCSGNTS